MFIGTNMACICHESKTNGKAKMLRTVCVILSATYQERKLVKRGLDSALVDSGLTPGGSWGGGCWFCIFLSFANWKATLYPALRGNPYPTPFWFELDLRCCTSHCTSSPAHLSSAFATPPACAHRPSASSF